MFFFIFSYVSECMVCDCEILGDHQFSRSLIGLRTRETKPKIGVFLLHTTQSSKDILDEKGINILLEFRKTTCIRPCQLPSIWVVRKNKK